MNMETYFIEKLGLPTNQQVLEEYFSICVSTDATEYTEIHHILPRSIFPEYVNESWNQVRLTYSTHCLAHELLWCAYPHIGSFWRPLNFMKSQNPDMREKMSEAMRVRANALWSIMKSDPEKMKQWSENKRTLMLERMQKNHPAYEEMRMKLNLYYENSPDAKIIRSVASKKMWQDPEMRKKIIAGQKEWAQSEESRKQKSQNAKKRYDDVVYYEAHKKNMAKINVCEEKKSKNRQTILMKWQDPEFAAYMREKIAAGRKNRKSSSEAMKKLWSDPIRKAEMLERRKQTRKNKVKNETN